MSQPTDTETTLETMAERRDQLRKHLLDTASKIRSLVVKDIRRFIEREARWRWLQHLDFADNMSNDEILALKAKLAKLGEESGKAVEQDLSAEGVWLAPHDAPPADQAKTLEHNQEVWAILQKVAFDLGGVLDATNFPADPGDNGVDGRPKYDLVYRTPVYFLDGVYCPSLIETYWSQLGELRKLVDTMDDTRAGDRRRKLEERWGSL